jgi:DNA (cytosine-5)-methyltransferase 1
LNTFQAVDLFCGAGGTSTGLIQAADQLGLKADLTAINHWDKAIETHSKNHPQVRHKCESLDNINPRKLFPEGRIKLLLASPECTHHSNARGGRPCSDQSRSGAWEIVR